MRRLDLKGAAKVVVVDDNFEHAMGIKELVNLESPCNVVGVAANSDVAISLIKKNNPDLVLMDINMPDVDGITAIQKIRKFNTDVKIIALTGYDDADLIYRTMKVGANGYILKTMASSQLIYAIEEILSGKIYLPTVLASKFFEHFQKALNEDNDAGINDEDNLLNYLTQREEEVLELLTHGITYKGVASKLFISETTVKTHVNNIFQKLQVNDRTQAVLYALNHGIGNRRKVKATA
ncbi:MAG TPA: response regulator transcription factor [Candidatus Adamsella sp.]|nr:response regulator transcription factor [Candidatus Adamsella sp.]